MGRETISFDLLRSNGRCEMALERHETFLLIEFWEFMVAFSSKGKDSRLDSDMSKPDNLDAMMNVLTIHGHRHWLLKLICIRGELSENNIPISANLRRPGPSGQNGRNPSNCTYCVWLFGMI